MSSKLCWFAWHPAEAAIDGWWMSLTLAEQGLHMRLLSFAWVNGGLENDLNRVAASVGLSRKEFDKHWPKVSEKWVFNGEFVVNKRQEIERKRVKTKSEQALRAINTRWGKRNTDEDTDVSIPYQSRITDVLPRASDCLFVLNSSMSQQQETSRKNPQTENQETQNKLSRLDREFEQFWGAVWAKIGKEAARRAYAKARKKTAAAAILKAAIDQGPELLSEAEKHDRTVLHPATWLNQGRYLDEPQKVAAIDDFRPTTDAQYAEMWGMTEAEYVAFEAERARR